MAGRQMNWLLALIAGSSPDDKPLDPIRIQKGIFLLQQTGVIPRGDRYEYRAFSYGPAAFAIYDDLRFLQTEGAVVGEESEGHSFHLYRATLLGRRQADAFRAQLHAKTRQELDSVRVLVADKTFRELLEYVYSRYPKYAEKSVVSL
jgi:hypothetical protein